MMDLILGGAPTREYSKLGIATADHANMSRRSADNVFLCHALLKPNVDIKSGDGLLTVFAEPTALGVLVGDARFYVVLAHQDPPCSQLH